MLAAGTCWLWLSTVSTSKRSWPQPFRGCFTVWDTVIALGQGEYIFHEQNYFLVYLTLSSPNALTADICHVLMTNLYSETTAFKLICVMNHFSCGSAFFSCSAWFLTPPSLPAHPPQHTMFFHLILWDKRKAFSSPPLGLEKNSPHLEAIHIWKISSGIPCFEIQTM